MKKLLYALMCISLTALASGNMDPLPEGYVNNGPSPEGPTVIAKKNSSLIKLRGDTYTYMRCYYRINPASTSPRADYVWALNTGSTSYYHLQGYWWSSLPTSWKNMFYSNTQPAVLNQVCKDTLSRAGIRQPLAMIAAADNKLSFNHTIWSNDLPAAVKGINRIIAFGDSLTDTNNIFNASLWRFPNPASWFLGRFSNGLTWVEYLAKLSHLPVYNWAVGGAASNQQKLIIPGLLQQVDSWLVYMKEAKNYHPENSLFTVWIGANDLVTYNQEVDGLITNQTRALNQLAAAGAKNIVVLNLPDITRAPEFTFRKDSEVIKRKVDDYNARIKGVIDDINRRYPGLSMRLFDLATLFTDMLDNPTRYQVSDVKTSCLDIKAPSSLNYIDAIPVRASCTNADTYVFWDLMHPTTNTHRLLAEHVASFLKQQKILP